MSDQQQPNSEDGVRRFRRLLSDTGDDIFDENGEFSGEYSTEELSHHPTGEPDVIGGWFGEEFPADIKADFETTEDKGESEDDKIKLGNNVEYTPPPPDLGKTPPSAPPAIGTYGLPLPRRIPETDYDATRAAPYVHRQTPTKPVTPPSGQPSMPTIQRPVTRPPQGSQPSVGRRYPTTPPPARRPPPPPQRKKSSSEDDGFDWRVAFGCLARALVIGLFGLVVVLVCAASFVLVQYYRIAKDLPDIENLRQRASQFETTRILDRNGNVIYEILDPNAGRRTYIPLERISPYLVAATIATEDKEYYSHPLQFSVLFIRILKVATQFRERLRLRNS